MPITAYTPLVAGATMQWSVPQQNNDNVRTFINDVPLADVDGSSIAREHLVRPVVLGFPEHGAFGGFQTLRGRKYGDPVRGPNQWGALPNRCAIVVDAADMASDRKHITPIGATFWTPAASVQVQLTANLWNRYDSPTVSLGDETGHIELVAVDRQTGTVTTRTETRRIVYATPISRPVSMMASYDVSAGDHDVYLQFVRSSSIAGNNEHIQIDLSDITLTVRTL